MYMYLVYSVPVAMVLIQVIRMLYLLGCVHINHNEHKTLTNEIQTMKSLV